MSGSDTVEEAWLQLTAEQGQKLLAEAKKLQQSGLQDAALQQQLRAGGADPQLVAAALTQIELRSKAQKKFGALANELLFTQAGLEQASRMQLTAQHAKRLRQLGVEHVYELGCGIGAEALSFAAAGIRVTAVEIDPLTAAFAKYNLQLLHAALKVSFPTKTFPEPEVICADATTFDAAEIAAPNTAVFFDPARRTAGHRDTKRVSAKDYSPGLDFVFATARHLTTLVKLGPGFDRELIPDSAAAEWVSVNGEAVETLLVFAQPAAMQQKFLAGSRKATVFSSYNSGAVGIASEITHDNSGEHENKHSAVIAPVAAALRTNCQELKRWHKNSVYGATDSPDPELRELGAYLFEPDAAVIRARQIGKLAQQLNAGLLSEKIAYLTGDELADTQLAQTFKVLEVLPLKDKVIRKRLNELEVTAIEIKKRGVDIDPALFRKKLKLPTGKKTAKKQLTLVLTRVNEAHRALLCERIAYEL